MRKVVQLLGCGSRNKMVASMLIAAMAVLSLAGPMFGQTANGRISGTVKDQTGGAIVGAAVVVTDTARGLARNLTTDEAGAYLAPNLIPGNYTVRATFTGFQAFERTNVALGVGQDLFIDVVLQPGAQTQTITITEELPLVNTTSSTLGGTLNNQTITDLPISGRNYVNLLELRPGTVLTLGNDSNGGGSASTNGLRSESSNSYAIEGLSGIDPYTGQSVTNLIGVNGDAATLLPLDAIQEFNQQFNSKAEYGSKAGSNVAVGLKSGTNALHGTAYGFFRNTSTDALNYYNPYDSVGGTKTPIDIGGNQRQFGGTVGGPIKKDKLFFFAGYEQMHLDVGSPRSINAFFTDPGMLNCTGAGATYACSAKAGLFPNVQGGTAMPDASNHIILSCLALKNAGVTPAQQSLDMLGMNTNCELPGGTTASGQAFAAGTVNPDFFVNHGANDHGSQGPNNSSITTFYPNNDTTVLALGGVAKIDYTFNERNSFNGFYYRGYGQRFDGLGAQPSDRYRTEFLQYAQMAAGTWTWLPSSTIANSFRLGYASLNEPDYGMDERLGLSAAQLGFNTGISDKTAVAANGVAQSLTPAGFYAIGSRQSDLQGVGKSFEISDALSYLRGKHSLKFGGSMIRDAQDIAIQANNKGVWAFGLAAASGTTDSGVPSFLLGQQAIPAGGVLDPDGAGITPSVTVRVNTTGGGARNTGLQSVNLLVGNPFAHATRNNFAFYAQDDFRVTQRVTLNLGLRYDYSTPLRSHNGVLGNFDPNFAAGVVQEGVNVDHIYNSNTKNFAPRVGFAWDVFGNGKTVIRGGGSIVYDLVTLRTYLEVGNDQGLAGVPTGFITSCNGTLSDSNFTATNLTNCSGPVGTPGGSRQVGSVAWSANNANILGNVLWDYRSTIVGPSLIQTGRAATQTILPDATKVLLNCNPNIKTKETAGSQPRIGVTCGIPGIDRDLKTPYVETWTLGIQHAIVNNVLLDVAYVGNHGVNLLDKNNPNQPATGAGYFYTPTGIASYNNCNAQRVATVAGSTICGNPDGAVSSSTAGTLRPLWTKFPWMADVTQVINGDVSNYDGLQASVTVRNFHGLSLVSGYTWSHSLSISDNNNGGLGTDTYLRSLDYGAAGADLRHRFSLSPTYALPGHAGMHGLMEGWKLNGSFRYQTGRPLSYTLGNIDFGGIGRTAGMRWDLAGDAAAFTIDPSQNVGNVRNPNLAQYYPGCAVSFTTDTSLACTGAGELPSGINPRTGVAYATGDLSMQNAACVTAAGSSVPKLAMLRAYGCWVSPDGSAVLTPPALGTYGNSTKNQFRGLSFWQADASITKRQKVTERFSAEFRYEVFNLLNHPNFAQPSGALSTSCSTTTCGFQSITATPDVSATNPIIGTGGPRRMQFGVKILF